MSTFCQVCGVTIRTGKYCLEHRNPKHRARDARALATRAAEAGVRMEAVEKLLGPRQQPIAESWRAALLAVMRSLSSDPAVAASMAGISVDPDGMIQLDEEARKNYGDLTNPTGVGITRILNILIAAASIRSLAALPTMSAQNLAMTMRGAAAIQQAFGGTGGSSYGCIELRLPSELFATVVST